MYSSLRYCLVVVAALMVAGCTQIGVSNPFSTVSDVREVYYGQFSDIPVPVEMKSSASGTLVASGQNGSLTGLETFDGKVEAASLANAMIHNMARQGWSLRGSITGKRTIQIHEKDRRFAVLCISSQTLGTSMEVWVMNRLSDAGSGFIPASPAPTSTYSPPPASAAVEQWEGGVTSTGLNQ